MEELGLFIFRVGGGLALTALAVLVAAFAVMVIKVTFGEYK